MAGKRISKASVDWAELLLRVPVAQKVEFMSFKAKSDGYISKMMALPENPPSIDWNYYKKHAADPSIVESFEKQYASLKIPYPKADEAFAEVDVLEKQSIESIDAFVKESNARIEQYLKDIETVKNTIPIQDMTAEEASYKFPLQMEVLALQQPTFWPHEDEEFQFDAKSLDRYRTYWKVIPKSDVYHPY